MARQADMYGHRAGRQMDAYFDQDAYQVPRGVGARHACPVADTYHFKPWRDVGRSPVWSRQEAMRNGTLRKAKPDKSRKKKRNQQPEWLKKI